MQSAFFSVFCHLRKQGVLGARCLGFLDAIDDLLRGVALSISQQVVRHFPEHVQRALAQLAGRRRTAKKRLGAAAGAVAFTKLGAAQTPRELATDPNSPELKKKGGKGGKKADGDAEEPAGRSVAGTRRISSLLFE